MTTVVTHWFPIVTFCPVNGLPDLIFISITFDGFEELYAVRKQLRRFWFRRAFMENIALEVLELFETAERVDVRLLFSKHLVSVTRDYL